MTIKYNRLIRKSIEDLPALLVLGCVIHVSLLLLGVELPVFEYIAVLVFDVFLYLFSVGFELCFLHRLQVYYVALMFTCIFLNKWGVFGRYLTAARWIVLILGLLLLILTIIKRYRHAYKQTDSGDAVSRDR